MNPKDVAYYVAFFTGAVIVGAIVRLMFPGNKLFVAIGAIGGGWVAGFIVDQMMRAKNRRKPGDDDDLR